MMLIVACWSSILTLTSAVAFTCPLEARVSRSDPSHCPRSVATKGNLLLQTQRRHKARVSTLDSEGGKRCKVGDDVQCPGTAARCAGKSCCPGKDGGLNFPCPSAPAGWGAGRCQRPEKVSDCTSAEVREETSARPPKQAPRAPARAPSWRAPANADGIRLMSFNVWHGNHHFTAIADLIQRQVDPDVVNLQEAVNHQPAAILAALNARHPGKWALANEWKHAHYWCGLNAYRSDRWTLEWKKEVSFQNDRGICGARLRRKSDNVGLCVWGTHPIWYPGGPSWSVKKGIAAGAAAMRECVQDGSLSALMCDCNTADAHAVRGQLEEFTGFDWNVAQADGYDQIFVQRRQPSANVDVATTGGTIAPFSGNRGCQDRCQNPRWAFADHPPVYADLRIR